METPHVTLPATLHAVAETTTVLEGIAVDGVSDQTVVLVSLVVGHGRLSIARAVHPSFLLGTGRGDTHMSFFGSLAVVNAALGQLRYRGGEVGEDTLVVAVSLPGGLGHRAQAGSAQRRIQVSRASQSSVFQDPDLHRPETWDWFLNLGRLGQRRETGLTLT